MTSFVDDGDRSLSPLGMSWLDGRVVNAQQAKHLLKPPWESIKHIKLRRMLCQIGPPLATMRIVDILSGKLHLVHTELGRKACYLSRVIQQENQQKLLRPYFVRLNNCLPPRVHEDEELIGSKSKTGKLPFKKCLDFFYYYYYFACVCVCIVPSASVCRLYGHSGIYISFASLFWDYTYIFFVFIAPCFVYKQANMPRSTGRKRQLHTAKDFLLHQRSQSVVSVFFSSSANKSKIFYFSHAKQQPSFMTLQLICGCVGGHSVIVD